MAVQEFGTNHPMTVKRYAVGAEAIALKKCYALRFAGRGGDSLIQIKDELSKGAGDLLYYNLRAQVDGDPLGNSDTFEGNESTLDFYTTSITLDEVGKPFRWKTQMDPQRVTIDQLEEVKLAAADYAKNLIDVAFFNQIAGNTAETNLHWTGENAVVAPTTDHIVYPASITADEDLDTTAGHEFTLERVDVAIERAKTYDVPLRPLNIDGKEMFVCFLHPYQVSDLRATGSRWDDIQMALLHGGYKVDNNPILTGALGVYNGVLFLESTRVPNGVSGATGLALSDTRRAILCGAQAASIVWGRTGGTPERFRWQEATFDFGRQQGIAWSMIWGLKKNVFNSSDFSTIVIPSYSPAG